MSHGIIRLSFRMTSLHCLHIPSIYCRIGQIAPFFDYINARKVSPLKANVRYWAFSKYPVSKDYWWPRKILNVININPLWNNNMCHQNSMNDAICYYLILYMVFFFQSMLHPSNPVPPVLQPGDKPPSNPYMPNNAPGKHKSKKFYVTLI